LAQGQRPSDRRGRGEGGAGATPPQGQPLADARPKMPDIAGSFKWKSDEYIGRHGTESLLLRDWGEKEKAKHRPEDFSGGQETATSFKLRGGRQEPAEQASLPESPASGLGARGGGGFPTSPIGNSLAANIQLGSGAPPEWPPGKAPLSLAQKVATARGRIAAKGTEDWDWCRPRLRAPLASSIPDGPLESRMHRTLSSPSTLTGEGKEEAQRVLGNMAQLQSPVRRPARPTSSMEPLADQKPKKFPQTCNQMYGALAHQADRSSKFLPKSTCDVCLFVDAANKSLTPYNASIRF